MYYLFKSKLNKNIAVWKIESGSLYGHIDCFLNNDTTLSDEETIKIINECFQDGLSHEDLIKNIEFVICSDNMDDIRTRAVLEML